MSDANASRMSFSSSTTRIFFTAAFTGSGLGPRAFAPLVLLHEFGDELLVRLRNLRELQPQAVFPLGFDHAADDGRDDLGRAGRFGRSLRNKNGTAGEQVDAGGLGDEDADLDAAAAL